MASLTFYILPLVPPAPPLPPDFQFLQGSVTNSLAGGTLPPNVRGAAVGGISRAIYRDPYLWGMITIMYSWHFFVLGLRYSEQIKEVRNLFYFWTCNSLCLFWKLQPKILWNSVDHGLITNPLLLTGFSIDIYQNNEMEDSCQFLCPIQSQIKSLAGTMQKMYIECRLCPFPWTTAEEKGITCACTYPHNSAVRYRSGHYASIQMGKRGMGKSERLGQAHRGFPAEVRVESSSLSWFTCPAPPTATVLISLIVSELTAPQINGKGWWPSLKRRNGWWRYGFNRWDGKVWWMGAPYFVFGELD